MPAGWLGAPSGRLQLWPPLREDSGVGVTQSFPRTASGSFISGRKAALLSAGAGSGGRRLCSVPASALPEQPPRWQDADTRLGLREPGGSGGPRGALRQRLG